MQYITELCTRYIVQCWNERKNSKKNRNFFRCFYRTKFRELFFSVKNKIKNKLYCTMCDFLWFLRGLFEKWPFFGERSLLGLFNPLQIRVFFMLSWYLFSSMKIWHEFERYFCVFWQYLRGVWISKKIG